MRAWIGRGGAFAAIRHGVRLVLMLALAVLLAACSRPDALPDLPFSTAYAARTSWMMTTAASTRPTRAEEDAIIARAITEHERRHP